MRKYILIILLSIITLGCNTGVHNSKIATIEATLIAKGDIFEDGEEGITEQNLIISDTTAWNSLITQMNSINNGFKGLLETDIDFSKYKIIAVFEETKRNGGYSLELDIVANPNNIIIKTTDVTPEANAITVVTQPFHIVKITNSDLPILFE